MSEQTCYENYPLRIVALSNLLNFSIWIIGAYLLLGFGILFSILFLVYCIVMEFRVLTRSCVNCYYYGKICFSGRGKVCSLLFKKGKSGNFVTDKVTWKDILPDFMVSIFPIIGGIVLLIISFSWLIVLLLVILVLLTTAGNSVIRGSFACKNCKQREIGCPAQKLFETSKMENHETSLEKN
ncbi:MAG: class I serpentine receptor [Thermoplasmata archaeon]|nr:class I serpentine receptor [Thermoplasmata archaeon]